MRSTESSPAPTFLSVGGLVRKPSGVHMLNVVHGCVLPGCAWPTGRPDLRFSSGFSGKLSLLVSLPPFLQHDPTI